MPAHEVRQSGNVIEDVLTDEVSGIRIAVNREGAEMVSLARLDSAGEWKGFLYRDGETGAPATGWGNHATVMGYFLHRLQNEQSTYRGHIIHGGNHGFLRHFQFDAPELRGAGLVYKVSADRVPPDAYPLNVSFELTYTLENGRLTVSFAFKNEEPELDAHVSFGLHPGFAVQSVAGARLLMPAGTYHRYYAPGNFLDGRVEDLIFAGGEMPFDKQKLPDSYLLGLDSLTDRTFVLEDRAGGRRVELDFSEVPYLTLWSDLNPFLCVEPCWGLPDSTPQRPFDQKIGIQVIPPGQTLRKHFSITPSLFS